MATDVSKLKAQIRTLDRAEQEEVLHALIEALDPSCDAEVEAAWMDEIQRRCDEIDAGTAVLIPAETVYARIFNELGLENDICKLHRGR